MADNGKRKMEDNAEIEFNSPSERVVLSKKIAIHATPSASVDNFESLFKVSMRTFNYIRSIVSPPMMFNRSNYKFLNGKPMSINDQIAIALKRLSSVDSSVNIATLFQTNRLTVDSITRRFVAALIASGLHHISWPKDTTQMKEGFKSFDMPNCCGVIGSTNLKLYHNDNEDEFDMWVDRENNRSMILQAIVDDEMRLLDVVTGYPGFMSNDNVLEHSQFYKEAQTGKRLNGSEIKLGEGIKLREYLLGGSGFPLLPWLITPYKNEQLNDDRAYFNIKHLVARSVANLALKKLKNVWAVIDGGMWKLNRHELPKIVLACCILYNIKIEMERNEVPDASTRVSCEHDPGYQPEISEVADEEAVLVRDKLCLCLAPNLPF